ncbi:MAG: hypothetical protein QXG39_04140 [Candidatus Aenigmatarchaeota archaeon]
MKTGICKVCGEEYPINELRVVYVNPQERIFICNRCDFKNRIRRSLGLKPKLGLK